jgi:site-specific recombinase XerD
MAGLSSLTIQQAATLLQRGQVSCSRRMRLGSSYLRHLFTYLDQAYPGRKNALGSRKMGDNPLFVSEQGHGLTKSSLTSVMNRLRTRAGGQRGRDDSPELASQLCVPVKIYAAFPSTVPKLLTSTLASKK